MAVSALFARAVHLAAAEHPWLSDVISKEGDCGLDADAIKGHSLAPDAIEQGLTAVLAHDVGLLTALIGEDFVMPLLQKAWGEASPADWAAPSEGHHE
jgi:hypothetical protein